MNTLDRNNEFLSQAAALLRRSNLREGKPFPLGATWDGLGVNFALFSAHATKVELCLFDDAGENELERIDVGISRKPETSWERTVFYEMHVKGFTKLHPLVTDAQRGTFAGLANPSIPAYLRSLGITSAEFLPIHAFVDDSYLMEKGLRNYWGYNSLAFFAPEPRYQHSASANEFKTMVNQFHAHGIEVILDVVYNHTAEGNELGPTLSFKGIDNTSYYRSMPDQKRYYINDTGTGNTVNLSHQRVLQMVADSLRYWATEMRVDGFRFDLATILAREPYGFDEGGGFLDACRQDPILSSVKLIAEPWDIGPGGYQVGKFPPGWAEWNDKFRDTVRAFWKGDNGVLSDFAKRITGSGDLFNKRGRKPWSTINFVTAHDGFNLNDLVSYNDKHNDANGEGNGDGHSNNHSWNHGVEGPTTDVGIIALRERQKRNFLATMILSHGTPMLLAGDEFGHSQNGNNNAYAQDNETTWLDWLAISPNGRALREFTRKLIATRKAFPILYRSRFVVGALNEELDVKGATWLSPTSDEMTVDQWNDGSARCFGLMLDGRAQESGIKRRGSDATLLLIYNAHHDMVNFKLPDVADGREWLLLIDTNQPEAQPNSFSFGHDYAITGRSMVAFGLAAEDSATRRLSQGMGAILEVMELPLST